MRTAPALLCAVLALAPALAAAEVRVSGDVDARRIGAEDTVTFTLTLEGDAQLAADVGPPPLRNLRVVGGPSLSTQVAFVNGSFSQSRAYSWVLQPLGPGPAQVGPVTVRLTEGARTVGAVAVDVVPGSLQARRAPTSPFNRADPFGGMFGADPFGSVRGRVTEPKLVVEMHASREKLHVGEPLVLSWALYTQASVSDLQFVKAPEFPGFWSEELDKPETAPGGDPVEVSGERYRRFVFLRRLVFPTRAGKLTIPPSTLRMQTQGGFFDPGTSVQRSTRPLTVEVLPLPDAPGFSGAVGRYEVSSSLDRASVPLGEAATLRFTVTGTGNLKWVERGPELKLPGARVYPPQQKSDLKVEAAGITGWRQWEYVLVPETAGPLDVPALTFAWFDPADGRIVSAASQPLRLEVTPGSPGSAAAPRPGPAPRDRGGLALRSDLELAPRRLPELSGRVLGLGLVGAVLLHAAVVLGAALLDRRAARSGHAPRGSVRGALADLRAASRPGQSKEQAAGLIEKALRDVFADVEDGAADGERERAARALLQEVQFIRYAPQLGDYSERIRDVARRAEEAVRRWA